MPPRRLRLTSLTVPHFGKFSDFNIDGLDADFVVVHGRNEAGKSTLTEALSWMIAGPYGTTSDALRFGDPKDKLRARLIADLDGQTLDLEGTFVLKERGLPSDDRRGFHGRAAVDVNQITGVLGGIVPQEFALIYRLAGASLASLDDNGTFAGLLSKYALGSMASDVDPRTVITELESLSKNEIGRAIKKLNDEVKELNKRINVATERPEQMMRMLDRVAELTAEIAACEERHVALVAHGQRLALADAAFACVADLRAAQAVLDRTDRPSVKWSMAIGNAADIERLLVERSDKDEDLRVARESAAESSRALGMDLDQIAALTLDTDSKDLLRESADTVQAADKQQRLAVVDVEDAEGRVTACRASLDAAAAALGLDVDKVASFHGREDSIAELNVVAVEWRNAARALPRVERDLQNAQSGVAGPRGSAVAGGRTRRPARWVGLLLVGLAAGGGIAAFVQPVIAAVCAFAAATVAAAWAFLGSDRSRTPADDRSGVISAEDVQTKETVLRLARERVSEAQQQFADHAASFGVSTANAEEAMSKVAQIDRARDAWVKHHAALTDLEHSRQELTRATTAMEVRSETFHRLLDDRHLVYRGPVEALAGWLDRCTNGIERVARVRSLEGEIDDLSRRITVLLGDAAEDARGWSDDHLRTVLGAQVETARTREEAEAAVDRATIAASAAVPGDEIARLTESVSDHAELKALIDENTSRIEVLVTDLHQMNDERSRLDEQVRQMGNEEVLATLLENRTRCLDEVADLGARQAAVQLARNLLRSSLETFERTHQTPLIEDAMAFIDSAIPEFGSVTYTPDLGSIPFVRETGGARLAVTKLSTGARTALYVALRLSMARADSEARGVALPILCDDPLVHVDDDRTTAMMRTLAEASKERQVIVFSCHQRSVDAAEHLGARIVRL